MSTAQLRPATRYRSPAERLEAERSAYLEADADRWERPRALAAVALSTAAAALTLTALAVLQPLQHFPG